MAIKGTVTVKGLDIPSYVKIYVQRIDERIVDNVKTFNALIRYELKKDANEQPVYSELLEFEVDVTKNIYKQIYKALALKLNISDAEA